MKIVLPDLPYPTDALTPFLSRETLETHHGKHHRGYVDKLLKQIEQTDYEQSTLKEVVRKSLKNNDIDVFNNAAQALNHSFLWESMSPEGGGVPDGPLKEQIDASFGGLDEFQKAFKDAATSQFGSGWVWLIRDAAGLRIVTTGNAGTPFVENVQPLLTLDVWEHAYYLDYKNERGRYVDTFLSDFINWSFAAQNHAAFRLAA